MYNNVTEAFLEKLRETAAQPHIRTGEDIGADYAHDELPGGQAYRPEAVVEAESTAEVAAVLALCGEYGVPVTVRGAGTGQAGGSVPVKGGLVLSLKGMNKILAYDEAGHSLRVQPGVLLQDVKAEAEKRGLYYPPDPGEQTATIGGNASTNAAGPCALKYGRTGDYILDAVIVLADGSIETLRSREEYAAVIGSEGTLAVITELSLKLIEKPGADAILLFPFMDSETAADAAKLILDAGFAPADAELMDTDLVEFSGKVTGDPVFPVEIGGERIGATLMLTLEGADDDEVMEKMEAIAEMAEDLGCLDILVGDTVSMKRAFRAAHSAFHTSMESGAKSAGEINLSVPAGAVAEMLAFAKAAGEEQGLRVLPYAHAGSGGMHIHAVSDLGREEFAPLFRVFSDRVYAKCAALGGDIAGEYGIGYAKIAYLPQEVREQFAARKAAFDPKGILNPGKVVG